MSTADTIIYICDICAEPVTAGTGYIELDLREMARYYAAHEAWKKDNPSGGGMDIWSLPERPEWHVWHGDCDPDPDHSGYWFAVERADTSWKLLDWCAHLAGKGYCQDTRWADFVQDNALTPHRQESARRGRREP